ncbi:basement membrane proteoglycan-like [Oscarella lobularis]|uniref:basement membrane proteoglycan-like n=1 Tax=Oscarella lobularis TaxID=121494 RepID=UPI0033131026
MRRNDKRHVCAQHQAHDNLDVLAYNMPLIDQLTAFPSNGTVRKGRSFSLDCSVNIPAGFAHWSMEWRLNGEVVKSQSVLSNFTYSLAHVNRNDSGTYSCAVLRNGNEIDLQTYPAPLNVTYAAQVTSFEVHSPNRLINASVR